MGLAELEGRENEDEIKSWSSEGELGLQGTPASHKPGWVSSADFQILELQLVGESWVSLLIGNFVPFQGQVGRGLDLALWEMSLPTQPIP